MTNLGTHYDETAYSLKYYHEHLDANGVRVRLEVHQRSDAGFAPKSIGELQGLTLQQQGAQDEIDVAIVKSSLVFSMVDTADRADTNTTKHGSWQEFYTPDATLYLVKLYTGTPATLRWCGYITPDSWQESLDYYGTISVTARDNIGHLQDFEFIPETYGGAEALISLYELLGFAADLVNLPMTLLVNDDNEDDAHSINQNGVKLSDMVVCTSVFKGMSWYEVLETVLGDLGYQLRYTDGGTMTVSPLRNLPLLGHTRKTDVPQRTIRFLGGTKVVQPAYKSMVDEMAYTYNEEIDHDPKRGLLFMDQYKNASFSVDYPVSRGWGRTSFVGYVKQTEPNDDEGWNGVLSFMQAPEYNGGEFELDASNLALLVANTTDSEDRSATYNLGRVRNAKVTVILEHIGNMVSVMSYLSKAVAEPAYLTSVDWQLIYKSGTSQYWYDDEGKSWRTSEKMNTRWIDGQYEQTVTFDSVNAANVDTLPLNGDIILKLSHPWFKGERTIMASGGFFMGVVNVTLSISNAKGVSGNIVRTVNNESYNIENTKTTKIGAMSRVVDWLTPQNYENVLYHLDGNGSPVMAGYTFGWDNYSTSALPLPVLIHLQRLCYHLTAMELLQGDCIEADNQGFRFDAIYAYKGSHYILQSGTLDLMSGNMEDGNYRQFLRYSDVWDDRPADYEIREGEAGTTAGSSSGTASAGSGSGGGGSRVRVVSKTDYAVELDINGETVTLLLDDGLFVAHKDSDGALESIEGKAGIWTPSFMSSGGKNTEGGGGGGSATGVPFIIPTGLTTFSTREKTGGLFNSANLVMSVYDNLNRVVVADIQVLESAGKYYVKVDFKDATPAQYRLVVFG